MSKREGDRENLETLVENRETSVKTRESTGFCSFLRPLKPTTMNKIKSSSLLVLVTLLAFAYLRFYYGSKSLLLNGIFNLLMVLILLGFGEFLLISILAWCASGIHPFLSRINNTKRVCDVPGAEVAAAIKRAGEHRRAHHQRAEDDGR